MVRLIIIVLLAIFRSVVCDDAAAATATAGSSTTTSVPPAPAVGGAYSYPPPPAAPPLGGLGGLPLGGLGFPGLGFHKNFDFNAGFGPYLGGLGGLQGLGGLGALGGLGGLQGLLGGGGPLGPVPVPGDEPIDPLLDGGFGGLGGPGFGGFGGFGPSYLPQTWIGSALGAKGDLLFPIVIFVFFVVGVWTVIQLLLGFIVPLIASKLAIKGAKAGALFGKRDVTGQETTSELDFITNAVLDALNEPKCLKYVACHSGQFLNGMAGGKEQTQSYEGILKSLSTMTHSDALAIFKNAFVDGKENCSQFKCHADHENTVDVDPAHNSASHNETENSVHS